MSIRFEIKDGKVIRCEALGSPFELATDIGMLVRKVWAPTQANDAVAGELLQRSILLALSPVPQNPLWQKGLAPDEKKFGKCVITTMVVPRKDGTE